MSSNKEDFKKVVSIIISKVFNCLPIKKNKIFLYSYYGSQYGCNPKYISEYMVKNYSKKFDIVWAFNCLEYKDDVEGIRKVKTMTLKYFYELCTSKVVITNFRTTDIFIKRKNQYYIQTWHSSLRLKQIERDAEEVLPKDYIKMAKKDSQKLDLLLSGCKYSTEIFKRAFWYQGQIFECGTPRNDILFNNDSNLDKHIRGKLGIKKGSKIILYAPTFRKNNELEIYDIDYSLVMKKLKEKFGGDWVFLIKLHPHLLLKSKHLTYEDNVINVTEYDDIQELLNISDILISDYSSLIFDFALTQRTCLLYTPDLKEYTNLDRNLYFDIKKLPFPYAENNIELIDNIEKLDLYKYTRNLKSFMKNIGSFEDGQCCKNIVNHIGKICFQ